MEDASKPENHSGQRNESVPSVKSQMLARGSSLFRLQTRRLRVSLFRKIIHIRISLYHPCDRNSYHNRNLTPPSQSNTQTPHDFDSYATAFFPVAETLESQMLAAQAANNKPQASALRLQAAAPYRIARISMPRSPQQKEAWTRNRIAFMSGASLLPTPYYKVQVPHMHSVTGEGSSISIYVRVPAHDSASSPCSMPHSNLRLR